MKIFDVDVSKKHIFFELDGETYAVLFEDSLLKGVHNVSILRGDRSADAKIQGMYPPLKNIILELWRIHFPLWINRKIRKFRQLHNR